MKLLPILGLALAVTAVSSFACPAEAAPQKGYAIDNHKRHVTVKDEHGSLVFAQIAPSDTVKIIGAVEQNGTRLVLEDSMENRLWSQIIKAPLASAIRGSWFVEFQAATKDASRSLRASGRAPISISTASRMDIVIGRGDHLELLRVFFSDKNGRHGISVVPRKGGFATEMDGHALPSVRVTGH